MDQENRKYLEEQIKLMEQEKEDLAKSLDMVSTKIEDYENMLNILKDKELKEKL